MMHNVGDHLPRMAGERANELALAVATSRHKNGARVYERYTYAELNQRADQWARGFTALGIEPGHRVALMVKPSLDFFALVFALFRLGAAPVMLDPAMGVRALSHCLNHVRPHSFVGIPAALWARQILGWAKTSLRVVVNVGAKAAFPFAMSRAEVFAQGAQLKTFSYPTTQSDDVAAILFTSGSTGVPKGAVYTHGNFLAQVEAIRVMYAIEPGEVDVPTFPLFALFDPALGMATVLPYMDFTKPGKVDPRVIGEAIRDFSATNMFGSPALVRRVANSSEQMPSLRRVLCAGAPVRADVMQAFLAHCAPSCVMHTPYGATESLPVATISSNEVLKDLRVRSAAGAGTCVGRVVASAEVRVIEISDAPIDMLEDVVVLTDGAVGEICVRGPQVTREYFELPEQTRAHKMLDRQGNVWHRIGDVGYLDDAGMLWFCGRKSHRVKTPKATLFTEQVEGVVNALGANVKSALIAGADGYAWLCLEGHESLESLRDVVESALQESRFDAYISRVIRVDKFPVDARHNAKIRREDLTRDREKLARAATWYTRKVAA